MSTNPIFFFVTEAEERAERCEDNEFPELCDCPCGCGDPLIYPDEDHVCATCAYGNHLIGENDSD